MKLQTEVTVDPAPFRLQPSSRIVLLGSCFAEEVGARLSDSLPEGQVTVNPCGVLYNPLSIAQALTLLLANHDERQAMIERSLFIARDERWHSWLFSTKYTAPTHDACLELCMAALPPSLQDTDLLILTLGTDHCYRLKEDGRVVANCHKEPAALFDEQEGDCTAAMLRVLQDITLRYPNLRMLLTVSPYRYAKYGFHQSQLSKARLLLLADRLCRCLQHVTYFPAYEILLDELRDYRFYAADMLHPSEQAADYIFERFSNWCFTPELATCAAELRKQKKRLCHRPII